MWVKWENKCACVQTEPTVHVFGGWIHADISSQSQGALRVCIRQTHKLISDLFPHELEFDCRKLLNRRFKIKRAWTAHLSLSPGNKQTWRCCPLLPLCLCCARGPDQHRPWCQQPSSWGWWVSRSTPAAPIRHSFSVATGGWHRKEDANTHCSVVKLRDSSSNGVFGSNSKHGPYKVLIHGYCFRFAERERTHSVMQHSSKERLEELFF